MGRAPPATAQRARAQMASRERRHAIQRVPLARASALFPRPMRHLTCRAPRSTKPWRPSQRRKSRQTGRRRLSRMMGLQPRWKRPKRWAWQVVPAGTAQAPGETRAAQGERRATAVRQTLSSDPVSSMARPIGQTSPSRSIASRIPASPEAHSQRRARRVPMRGQVAPPARAVPAAAEPAGPEAAAGLDPAVAPL